MKLKRNKISKLVEELDSERAKELLKCYSSLEVQQHNLVELGTLVWAKLYGSCYWPAIVVEFDDKPGEHTQEEPTQDRNNSEPHSCAFVIFLEEKFRFAAVQWERVIAVTESSIEEQADLVIKLNIVESKKSNIFSNPKFKKSIEYLIEFVQYDRKDRHKAAQEKFLAYEASRTRVGRRSRVNNDGSDKAVKIRNSCGGKVTLEWGSEVGTLADDVSRNFRESSSPIWFSGPSSSKRSSPNSGSESSKDSTLTRKRGVSLLPNFKKNDEPTRKHGRYSLRPAPVLQPLPQTVEEEPPMPSLETPSEVIQVEQDEDKRKGLRPKCGGTELRQWAVDRFEMLDKSFRLESQKSLICTASRCGKEIKAGDAQAYCHEFPFHEKCLTKVRGDDDEKRYKCQMCLEKKCFLCGVGDDACVKCSKCDLRYHIHCLRPFPQAEIQSETGPITCPMHFCHTCIAEHQIMKKVRNYKTGKTSSLRCIKCPTSYHRACIPASCLSSVMSNGFLICPRHQNFQAGSKSRRLGCFMCNRRLSCKGKPTVVNCIKCPLAYHLECVVDVTTFEGNEESLKEYMAAFECEACFWGLYPLPGQAVWCQQANYCFWPARILYPKEKLARSSHQVSDETFPVVYFGAQQSYFDGARYSRVVPLNIGAYDVLKKIKMYTDDPKLMTSYEEGTYVMDLSESYRTSLLQPPEPIYKKIERNVYKTVKPKSSHKKAHHNEMTSCSCHDDSTRDKICQFASGCINRDQAIECNDRTCGDASRCTNRMFSNYRSQPCFENIQAFPTSSKGWGVRTKIPLRKGDFVIEYLGEVVSKDLYQWRLRRKVPNDALYFLELDTNLYIDAEYMGNLSRLINHSCEPNCSTEKYISQGKQVVGIFANCDIPPGAELTFDYDYEISGKTFSCACGSSNCRGQINRNHIRNNQVGDSGLHPDSSPSQRRLDEEWNEECEICSYAGNALLCCEAPNCEKAYHATCLGLNSVPSGTWICPQHDSDESNRAKKKRNTAATTTDKRLAGLLPKRNDKENVQAKRARRKLNPPNSKKGNSKKINIKEVKKQSRQKKRKKDVTIETESNSIPR